MNPRATKLWRAVCVVFAAWGGSAALGADGAPDLPRGEIARRGREATAFLEVGPGRSATAFCIHPSGLFVTNDHVLQGQGQSTGGGIKLVVNSGTLEQKVLVAKVVRRDRVMDLALLRAEAVEGLHALTLGAEDRLEELTEVVVFGFPFGRGPGLPAGPGAAADQYPSISVNRGAISSLRRKDGRIERIQLNAAVNPGNSGGPLLDVGGRVVGVIVGRVEGQFGAGIDLAIPVNVLDRFLARPEIDFAPRTPGAAVKADETVEFKAGVVSPIPEAAPPELLLVFAAGTPAERRVPMARSGGAYTAKAVPFPATKGPASVAVEVKYADGSVRGLAEDRGLGAGVDGVRLGQLRSLLLSPKREAHAADGRVLDAAPEAPKELSVRVGGQTIKLDLGKALEIVVIDAESAGAVSCSVVALRAGEEVGRVSAPVYLEGAPRPSFDALREGRFVRPPRSTAPVSYLRIESSPGDYIGQGKNYAYEKDDLVVQGSGQGIRCQVGGFSNWSLILSAGQSRMLDVGEYRDAKRQPFSGDSPGIEFSGNGRGCNTLSGEFRIWELEMKGGQVVRLAADFVQRSEGKMPPLAGMLRFNSTFH